MSHVVSLSTLGPVLQTLSAQGLISDETPNVDIFDLDYLDARIDSLDQAFPEQFFLHAAAIKANSIRGIISEAKKKGMGAECASISEVVHALECGFDPGKIVYDSPCKSKVNLI